MLRLRSIFTLLSSLLALIVSPNILEFRIVSIKITTSSKLRKGFTAQYMKQLTLYQLGYFHSLFIPGGGGEANLPLSKNCLVRNRSKIFFAC